MGTWLKHDVITVVNAPLENVWNTWSDLDSMSVSYTHLTLPTKA